MQITQALLEKQKQIEGERDRQAALLEQQKQAEAKQDQQVEEQKQALAEAKGDRQEKQKQVEGEQDQQTALLEQQKQAEGREEERALAQAKQQALDQQERLKTSAEKLVEALALLQGDGRDQGRGQDKLDDEVEKRKTYIYFWHFYKKVWKVKDVLLVHPKDSSDVVRKANEHVRVGLRHFDTELGVLSPSTCYKTVVADGTHSIILMSTEEMDIDDELRGAATTLRQRALKGLSKVGLKGCVAEIDGDRKKITRYDMNEPGTQATDEEET